MTSTNSDATLQWARTTIRLCIEHHHCTHSLRLAKDVASNGPSRLIDLHAFGKRAKDARLVERSFSNPGIKYATLSHCWGGSLSDDKTTTTENLSSRKSRIPFSSLPQTFQESFSITRALGYRYIWIDALCSLQGSQNDWQIESSKMDVIYGQAQLNIAVAGSKNADGGCFNKQSSTMFEPAEDYHAIESQLSSGQSSVLIVTVPKDESRVRETWEPPQLADNPLAYRGWVCQERLLSPRILHFTSTQLLFECAMGCLSEEGFDLSESDSCTPARILRSLGPPSGNAAGSFAVIRTWYVNIISEEYSRRQLSRSSDKLIAIAGVAKVISEQVRSPYIAGLWLAYLHIGLAWRRVGRLSRLAEWRAPSFSWAFVEGAVQWDTWHILGPPSKAEFEVINYRLEHHDHDEFGGLNAGYLKLVGILRKAVARDLLADRIHERRERKQLIAENMELHDKTEKLLAASFEKLNALEQQAKAVENKVPKFVEAERIRLESIRKQETHNLRQMKARQRRNDEDYSLLQDHKEEVTDKFGIAITSVVISESVSSKKRVGSATLDFETEPSHDPIEIECFLLRRHEDGEGVEVLLLQPDGDCKRRIGVAYIEANTGFFSGCAQTEITII